MHEPLLFEEENDAIEEFFGTKILSTIVETELKETPMKDWLGRLRNHSYEIPEKGDPDAENEGYNSD